MNDVHPTAIIGDGVEMGDGNVIGPYAVILGRVHLGSRNWVGPHVVIGTPAEIRGIDHGTTTAPVGRGIVIGSGNVFREYTTIHQGHYAVTRIGDDAYFMNKVYVGHDNVIGDSVTMASSATLGGHVHVGPGANLGMGSIVHQRRIIGPATMIGIGSVVTRDVPPFALAYGNPCRVAGVNRVGMERAGIPAEIIEAAAQAYAEGRAPVRAEATAAAWDWWETERDSAARPAAGSVTSARGTVLAENMRA